jgi:hypothetical protein
VLTRIARARGIPVLELQHGMIGPTHLAYNVKPGRVPPAFPDHLLTFGDFYRDTTPRLPLPAERVHSVGFAWLERERELVRHERGENGHQRSVLFVSQGSIGRELSQVALALQEAKPSLRVVYRLHPSEAPSWQRTYPELERSALRVELPAQRTLYASLADADVQVGVYSTSLVEGLAFGLPTFVVALPGHEELSALVDQGHATRVNDAYDLAARLDECVSRPSEAVLAKLWQPDAVSRFGAVLEGFFR